MIWPKSRRNERNQAICTAWAPDLDAAVQPFSVVGGQCSKTQRAEFGQDIAAKHGLVFGPGFRPQGDHISLKGVPRYLRHRGCPAPGVPRFRWGLADIDAALELLGLFARGLRRPVRMRADRDSPLASARPVVHDEAPRAGVSGPDAETPDFRVVADPVAHRRRRQRPHHLFRKHLRHRRVRPVSARQRAKTG